jgi:hypothetical protein
MIMYFGTAERRTVDMQIDHPPELEALANALKDNCQTHDENDSVHVLTPRTSWSSWRLCVFKIFPCMPLPSEERSSSPSLLCSPTVEHG